MIWLGAGITIGPKVQLRRRSNSEINARSETLRHYFGRTCLRARCRHACASGECAHVDRDRHHYTWPRWLRRLRQRQLHCLQGICLFRRGDRRSWARALALKRHDDGIGQGHQRRKRWDGRLKPVAIWCPRKLVVLQGGRRRSWSRAVANRRHCGQHNDG